MMKINKVYLVIKLTLVGQNRYSMVANWSKHIYNQQSCFYFVTCPHKQWSRCFFRTMVNKLIINYKTLNAPDSVGWISKRKVFI